MTLGCHRNPPFRPRFQWETSSGTDSCSQSFNCGPTGATQQADYYADRHFGIEDTRVLIASRCRPTTFWEQAEMFRLRTGIRCAAVSISGMEQLDRLLTRRRPIGIAILCSRMTAKTRGHPFLGWHRITLLKQDNRYRTVNGRRRKVRGYLYTDPNFSPPGGHRPDPKGGHRWISRRELRYAWMEMAPHVAFVPEREKR